MTDLHAAGDAPQIWVEVDATRPVVQLTEVKVGKDADAGKLMLSWSGSDANLRQQPYTLSYAVAKEGPWSPIAGDLDKGVTSYVWTMPRDVPYRFWVRVEEWRESVKIIKQCLDLIQQTPKGEFWIPVKNQYVLPFNLAEMERKVYGSGEHFIQHGDIVP